jgi:hypothetical protein
MFNILLFLRVPMELLDTFRPEKIIVCLNNIGAVGGKKWHMTENLCSSCLLSIYFDLFSHARFTVTVGGFDKLGLDMFEDSFGGGC